MLSCTKYKKWYMWNILKLVKTFYTYNLYMITNHIYGVQITKILIKF